MTVSWRRSAEAADGVAEDVATDRGAAGVSVVSALPHFEQNLAPARLVAPQEGQHTGSAAPQASQNLLSSGVSEWQLGHSMSTTYPASRRFTETELERRGKWDRHRVRRMAPPVMRVRPAGGAPSTTTTQHVGAGRSLS